MELSPRSMASVWMVGLEDEPARCGEICVFEVFGDALATEGGRPTAAVGMGVHPFRDPALTDEFAAEPLAIDVADFHVYAADWRPGRVDFLVDGEHVRTVHQAPDYPMQMMIAVFDFPAKGDAATADHVPAAGRRPRPRGTSTPLAVAQSRGCGEPLFGDVADAQKGRRRACRPGGRDGGGLSPSAGPRPSAPRPRARPPSPRWTSTGACPAPPTTPTPSPRAAA